MQIHIINNGRQQGPYSIEKINSLITIGQLSPSNTLAWYEGCQEWIRLEDVPGARVATIAQSPPPPPSGAIPGIPTELAAPTPKPQKIKDAVLMLWISLGLGLFRSAGEIPDQAGHSASEFVVFVMAFVLLVNGFFIWMIDRGKNWARITFLALFILGAPLSISPLLQSLAHAPISGLLGIAQVILQTMAVIFLFVKESSTWFKLKRM